MSGPKLHIHILGTRINAFHFFGITGFICGILLGVTTALFLELSPYIVLMMALLGAVTFFALALLSKWITGDENIVYYHHEIGILVVCAIVLYLFNLPVLPYLDITIIGIGVFLGFGRIGCYSVGCCHGRPHKHGVVYGQQHVDAGFTWYYKDVPLLPVQVIESIYVFLIVIAGCVLLFNHVAAGTVLVCYTVIYGLMRYTLEFFRGDPERPLWYGISEAQWTTLALVAVTFVMSLGRWLPQYVWHGPILGLLLLITVIVIMFYRKRAKHILFNHRHVKEVAQALNFLNNENDSIVIESIQPITIYTTGSGLRLSCDQYYGKDFDIKQYTISFKKDFFLDKTCAARLAKLIGILQNHPGDFDIIEKQSGVYHIVFKKADYVDTIKQHMMNIKG